MPGDTVWAQQDNYSPACAQLRTWASGDPSSMARQSLFELKPAPTAQELHLLLNSIRESLERRRVPAFGSSLAPRANGQRASEAIVQVSEATRRWRGQGALGVFPSQVSFGGHNVGNLAAPRFLRWLFGRASTSCKVSARRGARALRHLQGLLVVQPISCWR